jgi:hypothetical protein
VEALENLYIEAILQNWRGKSIMSTLLRMGKD